MHVGGVKAHIIFHMDVLVSYLAQMSTLMKSIHRDLEDFPVLKQWVALLVPWGRRRRVRLSMYHIHYPPTPEIMAQSLTLFIICRAVATYFLWDYICKNRPGLLKPLLCLVKQYLPPAPIFHYDETWPWSKYKEARHRIFALQKKERKRQLAELHDQWLRYFPVQVTSPYPNFASPSPFSFSYSLPYILV
jgi:hypothetical protein